MIDWKAVGIGGLITAVLTIVLALAVFPLFFLGPIAGGFVTVYLINAETKDGVLHGTLAGIVGGLIIGILSLMGLGAIGAIVGLLLAKAGIIISTIGIIIGVFITVIAVLICGVLGAVGGVLGVAVAEPKTN